MSARPRNQAHFFEKVDVKRTLRIPHEPPSLSASRSPGVSKCAESE